MNRTVRSEYNEHILGFEVFDFAQREGKGPAYLADAVAEEAPDETWQRAAPVALLVAG